MREPLLAYKGYRNREDDEEPEPNPYAAWDEEPVDPETVPPDPQDEQPFQG